MDASKLKSFITTQKAKQQQNKQQTKFLKLKNGESRFVILPGWRKDEPEIFVHPYGAHWYVVPGATSKSGGQMWGMYLCQEKTNEKPCPFCQTVREVLTTIRSDEEAKEFRRKWMAQQTYLLNVLALDSENPDQPQVLQVCKTVFEQLTDIIAQWGLQVFDEKEPQIITIKRVQQGGMKVDYSVTVSPTKHKLPNGVLDNLVDLDAVCVSTNDELALQKINGIFSMSRSNVIEAPQKYAQIGATTVGAGAGAFAGSATDAEIAEEEDIPFESKVAEKTPAQNASSVNLDDDFSDLLNL